ncbi:methyl-accepting chemotaxis protein [Roseomonas rosulenta]|uniref:methyl-accepting chemotaxis protein n=1 Tax=Roseomonas rosulenta TaxID=2748667 RepID=UPI0018DF9F14|nr:methyl-accepting chemotaxis protein [Roseomonas rosulenta]
MVSNLSISNKLRLGVGLLLLLLALLVGTAVVFNRTVQTSVAALEDNWLPSILASSRINNAALDLRRTELALGVFEDPAVRQEQIAAASRLVREVNVAVEAYRPLVTPGDEARIFARIEGALRDVLGHHERIMAAVRAGDRARNNAALLDSRAAVTQLVAAIEDLNTLITRESTAATEVARSSMSTSITVTLALGGVAILLGLVIAAMLGRSISGRIVALSVALGSLARRDYGFENKAIAHKDEIGAMARALEECRDGLKEADRLAAAQAAQAAERAARTERIDTLVQAFEAEATAVLRTVSAAATELAATASAMTETAEDGTRQATVVAAASEQASMNVQTVAASTEELAASIAEVARQVRDTAGITNRAADAARETDTTVRGLAEAANKIGDVVRLISDIAGQTNLLALNATIEAARAGEAGKGFAVVASEVKNLATQTAKATEEIAAQISAMQAETGRTVEAIAAIARTIEELNANTSQVAAASEQQAAATQEIGRAVAEAAQGTQEASRSAIGVKQGAERTGGAAQDLRGASTELAEQSERLRGQVDGFLAGIRAA